MAIETRTNVHGFGDTAAAAAPTPVAIRRIPTTAQSVGLLLARVPLGAYFLLAGIGKYKMEGGVSRFVESHLAEATKLLPENLGRMYLTWLPGVEIALGALLIVGLATRVVAFLMAALLVSFIVGSTGFKNPPLPFHPNLIYVGLAAALVFCGGGRVSADGVLFGRRRTVTITEKYPEPL